jgi:uncharacterized protein (DUF885 family)
LEVIMHSLSRLLSLVVVLCAVASAAAETEDEKLAAFFRGFLDDEFRRRPLDATRLGEHRFDHLLDDLSPRARAGWVEAYRAALRQLPEKIDREKLSRSGQIDFDILGHHLTRSIWLLENTRPYETDPRVWNEYISDSVYLLFTQSTLPKPQTLRNAAGRIAEIPRVVAAARDSLKDCPRVMVETALRQNRGSISFYESGIWSLSGETPQLSDLREPVARAVAALKEYQTFLEKELLPRANDNWRLGKEKFARKLELELEAGLTAEQVLRDAEAEFARVERDMYVLARQLWSQTHPGKPLPPDDEDGRRDTIRQVLAVLGRNHGKPETLVQDARATVDRIRRFLRDNEILRLPDPDRCQVIEMPEFQRGNSTAYLNPAPPLDAKAASVYAVGPPPRDWDARRVTSYLEEYNAYMLQLLTIHEAYPGHYVQLEYSNRHPSLIRRVLSSGVFAEGWAVYTEQMMVDQGYGGGDPALRLHQLKWYLRAVANAILDHKMHCTGMTDEEALAFLTKRAFQFEGEALGKIVRAKQTSCQLSTYFVGRLAFYRLRQEVQREQGDRFDLGRYHEAVLDHGTLPVKYLPELVRERLKRPR